MKRSRLFLLVGVALAGVAMAVVLLEPTFVLRGYFRGEPFYANRPASYWQQALKGDDPAAQAEALKKLGEGGKAAVPVLVALLGQKKASAWDTAEVRWKAADLLRQLGSDAGEAAPALLEALGDDDPHVRAVAVASVAALSPPPAEALPKLIALLSAGDRASADAARALGKYGEGAKEAMPALIEAMQGAKDIEARRAAVKALGKIGPEAKGAVPVLTAALKDENEYIREHSAESLGQIGPDAEAAVPALVAALKDPVMKVRRDAARSLGQIGGAARSAVPQLKPLLKDESDLVRLAAAGALRRLDPEAAKAWVP